MFDAFFWSFPSNGGEINKRKCLIFCLGVRLVNNLSILIFINEHLNEGEKE